MDFILNNLTHFWAILALLLTLFGYKKVSRSKFLVINKGDTNIVTLPSDLDIKFNNRKLTTNLDYYRLLICYTGTNDIKTADVVVPLTVKNVDKNCRWHNLKVLNVSGNFKPKLRCVKNELQIISPIIKVGDAIELEFYLESSNKSISLVQRILNVETKSRVYVDNKSQLRSAFLFFIMSASFCFLLNNVISTFNSRHDFKDEYNVEYTYRGHIVVSDYRYEANSKVDSLYLVNYERNIVSKNGVESVDSSGNREDDELSELKRLGSSLNELSSSLDSLALHLNFFGRSNFPGKPSVLADSVYAILKQNNSLKFGEKIGVNNDLQIKFINPRENSWWSLISFSVISILILFFIVLSLFGSTYWAIEYYSVKKAQKYLKC